MTDIYKKLTYALIPTAVILAAGFIFSVAKLQAVNKTVVDSTNDLNGNGSEEQKPPELDECYVQERCEPLKTYTSAKLGISFQVANSAQIIERDKRITVGGEGGQYLEVFYKNPNKSLEDVVRSEDGPLDKCRLRSAVGSPEYSNGVGSYPDSYESVVVMANVVDWDRYSFDPIKPMLCNAKFIAFGGMRFYLTDTKNPEKYIRVEIGQYSISAGKELDWQDTIRFQ